MSEKMKKNTTPAEEKVEQREANPSVIIRRRRNAEGSADDAPKAEVETKTSDVAPAPQKKAKEKSPESSEGTSEKVQAKPAPKKENTAKAPAENATADAKPKEKLPQQAPKSAPAADSKKAPAPKAEAKAPKADKAVTDESKPKKRPAKPQKKIQETPARIITPVKVIAEVPAQAPEVVEVSAKPAVTKDIKKTADVAKDASVKSPKADNTQEQAATQKDADKSASKQKQKDADKVAPAASAMPDTDSAKSILPPAGTKTTRVVHEEQENSEPTTSQVRVISRPAVNAARVIEKAPPRAPGDQRRTDSRDGNRPQQPGGFRRDGNRPQQPGGFNRDGGNRPQQPGGFNRDGGNRPQQPGGFNRDGANRPQQPGGFNRDGNRPQQPGGFNRPQQPGGFTRPPQDKDAAGRTSRPARPATAGAPFAPAAPADNDQSRKKRNKGGRRTVEFGQNTAQDTTRRRNNAPVGMDDDGSFRHRKSRKPKKQIVPQSTQPMKAAKRKIRFEEAIRVADLAHQMGVKAGEIIKALFNLGVMSTINNSLDFDTATLIASEFDYEVENVGFSEDNYLATAEDTDPAKSKTPRPPVVTIMGHVDHGKTSLLDAIRKTSVTVGEAGGITQHIGAYHVQTKRGNIVFLDTPGHEAFTSMRARGAQVTDLVVLVVAADDGVMEQTREAINHSKAAGVPILVAVNKIDKEGADSDRVLRELADLGLQAEDWGGDTVVGFVSAKTGKGLDDLLELISIQAEVMELTANKDKIARGRVIEAKLDKGRGPVATVLIQEGTLRLGDAFVCGVFAGRVRAFFNDQGVKIKEAGPSIPVEIQGFDGVPEAGEEFICLTDEKAARRIAASRAVKQRERELSKQSRVTLETFLASAPTDTEAQVLNIVLKADVQGSLEAITEALHKLSTEKVRISVIHSGAGTITETDILLAAASHAIIIGFNVRPTAKVKGVAEHENVDIRFYDIIYKLVEEIKSAMAGMLAPISREVYLGQAEVRQPFSVPKIGSIAGSMVNDGKILRNHGARLLRDGIVVYTGKVSSLRRNKDDMKEVTKGFECGIKLENFNDVKIGDIIECFEIVEEAATL